MLKLWTTITIIITFIFQLHAQNISIKEKTWIEKIIQENDSKSDSVQLKKAFDKLAKGANSNQLQTLDIIYKVLLAGVYAQINDNINTQSTQYLNQAINIPKTHPLSAWVATRNGFYFYTYNNYEAALPYFMIAEQLMSQMPKNKSNIPMITEVFRNNAFFVGIMGEYEKSNQYLLTALENTPKAYADYGTLFFNLGNNFYQLGNSQKAYTYYEKTKNVALAVGDEVRYAKALGELAQLHKDKKEYDTAIVLLKEDIKISKKNNNDKNTTYAALMLSHIYINQNKYTEASPLLHEIYEYAVSKPYLKSLEYRVSKALLQLAIFQKNNTQELLLHRKIDSLAPIVAKMDGDEAILKSRLQIQKERMQHKLSIDNAKLEKANYYKITLSIITLLLAISIAMLIIAQKRKLRINNLKYDKKIIHLEIDKLKSEKDLKEKENSLDAHIQYLTLKNHQIAALEKELLLISKSNSINNKNKVHQLQELLSSHLLTEENWNNFKSAYINERADEYQEVLLQFPDISDASLRVVLLQKLGLTNQETAQVLGITIDAVKKSKQRLKKKYEVSKE